MPLPESGTIKMSQVKEELGTEGAINLGRSDVRTLANKPSGTIKMSDLHGKSSYIWEGQLTIGYNDTGMVSAYGYNREYNQGKLIPNIFNSFVVEQLIIAKNFFGANITDILILSFEKTTNFEWITILLNNKVYKLIDLFPGVKPDSGLVLKFFSGGQQLELFEYFKANEGKTIPVYILEAKLK